MEGCEREIWHCERRAQGGRSVCCLWCAANATWTSPRVVAVPCAVCCMPADSAFRPAPCAHAKHGLSAVYYGQFCCCCAKITFLLLASHKYNLPTRQKWPVSMPVSFVGKLYSRSEIITFLHKKITRKLVPHPKILLSYQRTTTRTTHHFTRSHQFPTATRLHLAAPPRWPSLAPLAMTTRLSQPTARSATLRIGTTLSGPDARLSLRLICCILPDNARIPPVGGLCAGRLTQSHLLAARSASTRAERTS